MNQYMHQAQVQGGVGSRGLSYERNHGYNNAWGYKKGLRRARRRHGKNIIKEQSNG